MTGFQLVESFVPCRRVKLLENCSHCLLMLFLTFCNIRTLHKASGEAANSVSVCRQIPAYASHAGRCPLRLFLKAVAVTRLAFVMPNGSDISFPKPQRLAFKLHYFTGKKKNKVDAKQDKCASSFYGERNRAFLEALLLCKTNLAAHNNTQL